MSNIIEERESYKKNPFFTGHEYSDFSPFYIAIAVCTVIGGLLFILNVICCCCSKYSEYWQDRHTGHRWLIPLWSSTPHKQPPLDYTELEKGFVPQPQVPFKTSQEYLELHKRESEI